MITNFDLFKENQIYSVPRSLGANTFLYTKEIGPDYITFLYIWNIGGRPKINIKRHDKEEVTSNLFFHKLNKYSNYRKFIGLLLEGEAI